MSRFQFISSRASRKNIARLIALALSICLLALSPRTPAEGLVPAELQVEYYNIAHCEARRSPCCGFLQEWSEPWGIVSGGVHSDPEAACSSLLAAHQAYQCTGGTGPTGTLVTGTTCQLTTFHPNGLQTQTTLERLDWICPDNSVPASNGFCACDPDLYPSGNSCEPCGCGHQVINGQCVEMARINQKVWQPNGDLWVYRYGVGVPCGITEHPQFPRPCDDQGNGPDDKQGNPISCASGVKTQTETDYHSTGPDPLTVQRFYSSTVEDEATGQVTPLNVMNDEYKVRLQYFSSKIVKLFWPDGGVYVFDVLGDFQGATGHSDQADKGTVERTATGWDYVTANGTRYRFGGGSLLGINRPGGHTQTVNYHVDGSGQGEIATVTNAFGVSLNYEYDEQGRLSQVQIPGGDVIRYGYDSQDRLISVTYPDDTPLDDSDNPTRLYHFENPDFPDALTGITDETGKRFATWAYDETGKAILSEHAGGAEKVTLEYLDDSHTRVRIYQSDTEYRDEVYTFEKRGGHYRVTEIETLPCIDCTVGSEQWQYNDAGYLLQFTDANGNITTYERDNRGREIARTEAVGTPDERTVTTQWHADFALPLQITEPGKTIAYTYDSQGNRLTETITDTIGACIDEGADGQGNGCARTTTYSYNSQGLLLTVNGPRTEVNDITTFGYNSQGNRITVTNALNHVTRIPDYDAHGNPLTLIDPNGIRTELQYDSRQRLVERTVAAGTADEAVITFEYDAVGNLTKIIQPNEAFLEYHYDAARRLIAIEDNQGNRIDYTLNAMGNRTLETIKDPNGVLVNTQSAVYNALGKMIEQLGAENQRTVYQYDANGNNLQLTDPKTQTTLQAFDALNRLIRLEDPENGPTASTRYEYDDQDNLIQVTDSKGLATHYQYNGFGELIKQSSPDTKTSTYRYDSAGNRIAQTDARGIEVHYVYDALNRLTAIDYPGMAEDIGYAYDQGDNGIGRLSAIDDASGITEYQYDARGNITEVTAQFPLPQGEGQGEVINNITLTTHYAYDDADNLIQITYPSGKAVDITRNSLSQIERIALNGNTLADNIQYQPFGPLTQLTYGNGLTETRTYDLDYRLQDLAIPNVHHLDYGYDLNSNIERTNNLLNTSQNQGFTYDTLDRLLTAQGSYGALGYGYDQVGNRLSLTQNDAVENYSYGLDNHHLLERGDIQYQYDAVGNTTHNSKFAFTYNQANRLSLVHDLEGKQVAEYHYNALGQRTIKIIGTEPPDYAALADEQDTIATQHRDNATEKQNQAITLETQATQNEQQALTNQQQAETLRQEAVEDRAEADSLEPQIAELEAEAQPWVERAERFRDRIVEPPQNIRDRVRNAAFTLVAGVFQAVADIYLNQATDLETQAQALRDGADAKEQQAAILDDEAAQLLADAEQAREDAQTLRTEVAELIALAEAAEILAAEYRALAENSPETEETTLFVYDQAGQLIGEYDVQGNPVREYMWLNDALIAMLQSGETYFSHSGHLNTPVVLTDSNRSIVWKVEYKPFGEVNETISEIEFNLRRPGQHFDSETGLHYNWFRHYDPGTGRYITSDPIGLSGGLNTYSYALQNPLRFSDPKGLAIWTGTATTFGVISGIGAVITKYVLESECFNGQKTIITVLAIGPAAGAGVIISGTTGNISFDDFGAAGEAPNPGIFNGTFSSINAGAAFGFQNPAVGKKFPNTNIPIPAKSGGGVSGNITGLGGALSVGAGMAEGFDLSASISGGSSRVTDLKVVDCDC